MIGSGYDKSLPWLRLDKREQQAGRRDRRPARSLQPRRLGAAAEGTAIRQLEMTAGRLAGIAAIISKAERIAERVGPIGGARFGCCHQRRLQDEQRDRGKRDSYAPVPAPAPHVASLTSVAAYHPRGMR
jgi:hypothetical protein